MSYNLKAFSVSECKTIQAYLSDRIKMLKASKNDPTSFIDPDKAELVIGILEASKRDVKRTQSKLKRMETK